MKQIINQMEKKFIESLSIFDISNVADEIKNK